MDTAKTLDRADLKILEVMQETGDIRLDELGAKVNLSRSQCSRRLERLRRDGYIARVAALLNPDRLGLGVKAYILVGLMPHVEIAHAFHEAVRKSPEILECNMMAGDTDFLLRVHTQDLKTLRKLIATLTSTKQVSTLKTNIVIEETKNISALPLLAHLRATS